MAQRSTQMAHFSFLSLTSAFESTSDVLESWHCISGWGGFYFTVRWHWSNGCLKTWRQLLQCVRTALIYVYSIKFSFVLLGKFLWKQLVGGNKYLLENKSSINSTSVCCYRQFLNGCQMDKGTEIPVWLVCSPFTQPLSIAFKIHYCIWF